MAHKFITFDIATAIKNAGYPQNYGEGTWYFTEEGKQHIYDSELYPYYGEVYCVCPTYFDVWIWLWRNGIQIDLDYATNTSSIFRYAMCCKTQDLKDPEDTIIEAIEYLVKNDLIK